MIQKSTSKGALILGTLSYPKNLINKRWWYFLSTGSIFSNVQINDKSVCRGAYLCLEESEQHDNFDLINGLSAMCSYYSFIGNCSDTCPIWKIVDGDCFPCNIGGEKLPEIKRAVSRWVNEVKKRED